MKENYKVHMVSAPIDWTVTVPGSKSMTNRALLMGSLADGKTTLSGVLFSDDSRHFLAALQALGFDVEIQEAQKQVTITGLNGKVPVTEGKIDVGSAGTAARFLTALLGVAEGTFTIQASEQMKKRPMKPLFDVLVAIGAKISYLEKEGHLPIQITGIGGTKAMDEVCCVALDISESTQFLSALLLISPMIKQGLSIAITSARKDGSYIQITRKMMENFGVEVMFDGENYNIRKDSSYKAGAYQIEPDISAACYFYAAAALTGGKALVKNVTWDCMQGDLQFLNVLAQMGCTITETAQGIVVCGAEGGRLKGITVDMKEFSDQTMTLAAIAPFAEEDVRIENVGHIRLQESDRIHAIATELSRLEVTCKEEKDALTIQPKMPNAGILALYGLRSKCADLP